MQSRVSDSELARFCGQLTSFLKSGLSLSRGLIILSKHYNNKFNAIIVEIVIKLENGISFSAALSSYGNLFPEVMVNLVKVGEEGGILEEMLEKTTIYFEEKITLKKTTQKALTYPLVVLSVSFAAFLFLLFFIIPSFSQLFSEMGIALPLLTQIVLSIGNLVSNYWYLIIMLSGLGVYQALRFSKSKKFDNFVIKLPLIGRIVKNIVISRSFRTMGSLLRGGVPILPALAAATNSCGNSVFKSAFQDLSAEIEKGEKVSQVMGKYSIFPATALQMLAVGEETGSLDTMFLQIAVYYEKETEYSMQNLTTLLEPAATLVVGAVVAVVILAMFMPMMAMVSALQ